MSTTTKFVLWTALLALGIYDLVTYLVEGSAATISRYVLDLSQQFPIVALFIGILVGHLFWPQRE